MTAFSDYSNQTADGFIESGSATYSIALAGSGTISANTTSTDRADTGQTLDTGVYYLTEAFFAFDTSSVPDTDVITNPGLSLMGWDIQTAGGAWTMYLGFYDWSTTLTTADWQDGTELAALTPIGHIDSTSFAFSRVAFTIDDATAFSAGINKTGITRFICWSSKMEGAGTAPTGSERWMPYPADAVTSTDRPLLTFDYDPSIALTTVRPDADVTTTGWATAPLWSKIEETSADGTVITATAS